MRAQAVGRHDENAVADSGHDSIGAPLENTPGRNGVGKGMPAPGAGDLETRPLDDSMLEESVLDDSMSGGSMSGESMAGASDVETTTGGVPIERGPGSSRYAIVSRGGSGSEAEGRAAPAPMEWGNGLWALGLVLAAIAGCYFLVRRFVPGSVMSEQDGMRIIARAAVTPKQSLALVRVGRRLVMVGVSPESMATLAEITDPEEVDEMSLSIEHHVGRSSGFGRYLSRESAGFARADVQTTQSELSDGESGESSSGDQPGANRRADRPGNRERRAATGGRSRKEVDSAEVASANGGTGQEKPETQGLSELLQRLRAMQSES